MKFLPVAFVIIWAVLAQLARKSRQERPPPAGPSAAPRAGAPPARESRAAAIDRRRLRLEEAVAERTEAERKVRAQRSASWRLPDPLPIGAVHTASASSDESAILREAPPAVITAPVAATTAVPAPASWRPAGPILAVADAPVERKDWAALLRQPASVRQAMVAAEILRRPGY